MFRLHIVHGPVLALVISLLTSDMCSANEYEQQPSATPQLLPDCPEWLAGYKFNQAQFTFVRIKFSSERDRSVRRVNPKRENWGSWATDWPDADRNLSAKIRQHTSLNVDPEGKILELTDPELSKHPFVYMAEPGSLVLKDNEVTALREYLLGGGFLMVDDFWGETEWEQFHTQIKRVFPNRDPRDLPLDHKIFHCVFDLKEKPQVPSIAVALSGSTTERWDAKEANYRAIFDDSGRMMVIACHNTDLGDGWEREERHEGYYQEFGAKKAYPMAINIIFFALTQ